MLRKILITAICVIAASPSLAAPAATYVIKDQEIVISAPEFEANGLRGKQLWLGDLTGEAGSAKFIRKGKDKDEVLLNEEFSDGYLLGYEEKATFLPVRTERLKDPAVQAVITAAFKGWPDLAELEFYKAAEFDFDGDGTAEQIIKANAPRSKPDPYAGDGNAAEGLFVLTKSGGSHRLLGKIVPDRGGEADPRTNVDLLAIGLNPATEEWNFLVRSRSQKTGEGNFSVTVTLNGESESSDPNQSISYKNQISVYRIAAGKLSAIANLSGNSWGTCFGSVCD